VLRNIVLSLFVDVWNMHFVLAMRAKNQVVFYVLLIHRERFAAIVASEIQQNVHVYKTPRWIF
jgi:hypothetical protein